MATQNNNIARNIFTVVIVIIIGLLVHILLSTKNNSTEDQNISLDSPDTSVTVPTTDDFDTFNDGLYNPSAETNMATDEYGVGITNIRVYLHDINNDGLTDRITRTHLENGTSHFTNQYKIELYTPDGYIDITPNDFRTIEGADCAVQKLRFVFHPVFTVEKIGRSIGETYITPEMAYKSVYRMDNNNLMEISVTPLKEICDVSELFY